MQKAGLHSFTQHLAMELADYNIRVNAVSRSSKYYSISRRFLAERRSRKALEGFNDFHPIGKFGSADEVANAIVFLLSDKSLDNWRYHRC
jgi:NAD(P)-dependent dehydrogenase (short-subunit alcohol dehydrogenase family)